MAISARSLPRRAGDIDPFRLMTRSSPRLLLLWGWVVVIFLLGGTSRPETASLMVLRPLGIVVLAAGLWSLTGAQLRQYRWLLTGAGAVLALHLAHLVPLPPQLWQQLPGRGLIAEIDRQAALGEVWRPLSLAPDWTWNSLWAFVVPLSVLIWGLQLTARERQQLVPLIVLIGAGSAFVALLQILGARDGPLYFYSSTNNGAAVGLFANRNHHAVFLVTLLPLTLAWLSLSSDARHPRRRLAPVGAGIVAAFIVPLILITGSRAGLLVGLLAVATLPLLARRSGVRPSHRKSWGWALAAALALLVGLTIVYGRDLAVDRLLGSDPESEGRLRMLPTVLHVFQTYLPWGSGLGSFEPVFQIHEPRALLQPAILNRAHNDWLELAVTGGIPAILLLLAGVGAWVWRATRLARREGRSNEEILLGRLGLLILLLLALASLTDYPVRIPSLGALAMLGVVWAAPLPHDQSRASSRRKSV